MKTTLLSENQFTSFNSFFGFLVLDGVINAKYGFNVIRIETGNINIYLL